MAAAAGGVVGAAPGTAQNINLIAPKESGGALRICARFAGLVNVVGTDWAWSLGWRLVRGNTIHGHTVNSVVPGSVALYDDRVIAGNEDSVVDAGTSSRGITAIIIRRIQSSGDHCTVVAHLQPTKNAEVRVKSAGAGVERDCH